MSVYPTNLTSDRLRLPSNIHGIPPDSKILGADRTPDFARLMLLSKLLFRLIFTASKA
jgi:hypothetical protein